MIKLRIIILLLVIYSLPVSGITNDLVQQYQDFYEIKDLKGENVYAKLLFIPHGMLSFLFPSFIWGGIILYTIKPNDKGLKKPKDPWVKFGFEWLFWKRKDMSNPIAADFLLSDLL